MPIATIVPDIRATVTLTARRPVSRRRGNHVHQMYHGVIAANLSAVASAREVLPNRLGEDDSQ